MENGGNLWQLLVHAEVPMGCALSSKVAAPETQPEAPC